MKNKKPSDRKVKRLERKIAKLQSKLNGESEPKPTKAEKKVHRAARKARWAQKLRALRPLNLKCIKWYEKRQTDIANGIVKEAKPADDGVVGGETAAA
jgi:chromosome segregation ATPase